MQKHLREEKVSTMLDVVRFALKDRDSLPALGTRKLIEEKDEVQPNCRVFQKFVLGDYEWVTYKEVGILAEQFGSGLLSLGQQPKQNIVILAETRKEWILAAIGCFKFNIPSKFLPLINCR
jgi:long-chain acyl-CoA synthetase